MGPALTVRPTGVRSFTGVYTGNLFGTGLDCSFKGGVRLTRVFVRRGSTVFIKLNWSLWIPINSNGLLIEQVLSFWGYQSIEQTFYALCAILLLHSPKRLQATLHRLTYPKGIHSYRYFLPSYSFVICSCIYAFCYELFDSSGECMNEWQLFQD